MPSWGWKETVPRREPPRRIGATLAGSKYAAVDTVLARLTGIEPLEIGCIASAAERDLFNPADVRTVGDDPAALAVPDFRKTLCIYWRQGWRRAGGFARSPPAVR